MGQGWGAGTVADRRLGLSDTYDSDEHRAERGVRVDAAEGRWPWPLPASGRSSALLPCTTMAAQGAGGRLGLRGLPDRGRNETSRCEAAPLPVLVACDADGITQPEDLARSGRLHPATPAVPSTSPPHAPWPGMHLVQDPTWPPAADLTLPTSCPTLPVATPPAGGLDSYVQGSCSRRTAH